MLVYRSEGISKGHANYYLLRSHQGTQVGVTRIAREGPDIGIDYTYDLFIHWWIPQALETMTALPPEQSAAMARKFWGFFHWAFEILDEQAARIGWVNTANASYYVDCLCQKLALHPYAARSIYRQWNEERLTWRALSGDASTD